MKHCEVVLIRLGLTKAEVGNKKNLVRGGCMLLHESDEMKYRLEVLTEVEAIIQAGIKHNQKGHEINKYLGQTRQTGYCVLCGRHIATDSKRRICLDCSEELEEWNKGVYTELFCNNCGKPYSL